MRPTDILFFFWEFAKGGDAVKNKKRSESVWKKDYRNLKRGMNNKDENFEAKVITWFFLQVYYSPLGSFSETVLVSTNNNHNKILKFTA